MTKFEEIKKANDTIVSTDISGKEYAEVNQRVKAFRMVYPDGSIKSEMVSNDGGICVFRAEVLDGTGRLLSTGTAYEKEGSTYINKTSYIENCETSAIGRALGFAGFGIDTSIASAEEVQNAKANQKEKPKTEKKATAEQVKLLKKYYTGEYETKLLKRNKVEKMEELSMKKASELIEALKGRNTK